MFSSSQPDSKYGPEVEECGYLKFVSPQKSKINDDSVTYFTIKLEQEDAIRRGVCFEAEMREEFQAREGQPIKIVCKRQLFDDSLVITKKQCIREVALSFSPTKFKESTFENILQISKDRSEREVNTIVTLLECKQDKRIVATRYGPRPIKTFIVSDTTSSIDLDVWGNEAIDTLEIGKTYSFKKLKAYVFSSQQKLSTMIDTEIQPILYSTEYVQNERLNSQENNPEMTQCQEEKPTGNLLPMLNFPDVNLFGANIKTEPGLNSYEEIQPNSKALPIETTSTINETLKAKSNTEELENKIGIKKMVEKQRENLDTDTSEIHLRYTGTMNSILIDEYHSCGKCHKKNKIPSNVRHFKCKQCKVMFKIGNYKKKLLSHCTLCEFEHTFKFDHKIIRKLNEKFPLSNDVETSMIEYDGNVTLSCIMFNDEYFVTDIIFHDK